MWKVALKYAVVCGVFLLIIFAISFRFGSNPLIDFRHLFFDLIMFSLFVYFSNKEFKSYKNGGILHFWQGMTLGFFTYVPATLIFVVGLIIYFQVDPNLLASFKGEAIEFLRSNEQEFLEDMSKETLDSRIETIKTITAAQMIASAAFKKLMAGFFVSPVITIILRKKPV